MVPFLVCGCGSWFVVMDWLKMCLYMERPGHGNEPRIMQDYTKLDVWKESHQLVLEIYQLTKNLPSEERFHLTKQIRSSTTSVPTNLVEGCGRYSQKDKAHFFQMAFGSASELGYQLLILRDLNYISPEKYSEVLARVVLLKKKLNALLGVVRKTLRKKPRTTNHKPQTLTSSR